MSKELRISKIQDKVEGLEVKGQGCRNDCKQGHWSGRSEERRVGKECGS